MHPFTILGCNSNGTLVLTFLALTSQRSYPTLLLWLRVRLALTSLLQGSSLSHISHAWELMAAHNRGYLLINVLGFLLMTSAVSGTWGWLLADPSNIVLIFLCVFYLSLLHDLSEFMINDVLYACFSILSPFWSCKFLGIWVSFTWSLHEVMFILYILHY